MIDGSNDNIIAQINLPDGSFPAGVGVNNITNKIYVTLQGPSQIAVINGNTNAVEKIIQLGIGEAYNLGAGNQKIWAIGVLSRCDKKFAVHFELHKLYIIGSNDEVEQVIDVEEMPLGIGVEQTDPCRVYVSHNVLRKISVFEDTTGCCNLPPGLSAGPKNESNRVGECHQIPITLTDASGNPIPDVKIYVSVTGANNIHQNLTTDGNGSAVFSYCGLKEGTDMINVCADTNNDQNCDYSTDVTKTWYKDSDDDGISDDDEGVGDADGDGVPNYLDSDADNDGILDSDEGMWDADNDGMPNYLDTDSDNDGKTDRGEGMGDNDQDGLPDFLDEDADGSTNPWWPGFVTDTDGDGLPDFLDDDSDGDGIPDKDEGTDDLDGDRKPNFRDLDSDGDEMPDKWEADNGLNPQNGNDAMEDPDNDELTNEGEWEHRTDPHNPDTDGDGYSDGYEVDFGSDPLDPNDYPRKVPALTQPSIILLVLLILVIVLVFLRKI